VVDPSRDSGDAVGHQEAKIIERPQYGQVVFDDKKTEASMDSLHALARQLAHLCDGWLCRYA
jgi:hypothetical protein